VSQKVGYDGGVASDPRAELTPEAWVEIDRLLDLGPGVRLDEEAWVRLKELLRQRYQGFSDRRVEAEHLNLVMDWLLYHGPALIMASGVELSEREKMELGRLERYLNATE
jgi:hypothetical protein